MNADGRKEVWSRRPPQPAGDRGTLL